MKPRTVNGMLINSREYYCLILSRNWFQDVKFIELNLTLFKSGNKIIGHASHLQVDKIGKPFAIVLYTQCDLTLYLLPKRDRDRDRDRDRGRTLNVYMWYK